MTSTIFAKLGPLMQGAGNNQISQNNSGVTGQIRKMEAKEAGKCPILLTRIIKY
jgi:hypothetical protein